MGGRRVQRSRPAPVECRRLRLRPRLAAARADRHMPPHGAALRNAPPRYRAPIGPASRPVETMERPAAGVTVLADGAREARLAQSARTRALARMRMHARECAQRADAIALIGFARIASRDSPRVATRRVPNLRRSPVCGYRTGRNASSRRSQPVASRPTATATGSCTCRRERQISRRSRLETDRQTGGRQQVRRSSAGAQSEPRRSE